MISPNFAVLGEFQVYPWIVLPLLIFLARICDVTLGTIRLIFVARGYRHLAPLIGFFEILIWIVAIGQIMQNLSNPACYLAYAGGFASGNYIGIVIAEKMLLGIVLVRVVTQREAHRLVERLRAHDYGVTSVDGQGASGAVQIIFTIVPRREVETVVGLVKEFNPRAFYSIEEVGFVKEGVFPERKDWGSARLLRLLWPLRKGK